MFNIDTELLFPLRIIPELENLRGEEWHGLVQKVSAAGSDIEDQLAFVLMMVKLGGCLTCNSDSFRAMRGCTQCASKTVRRFRGEDMELIELHHKYREDVEEYLDTINK